MLAIYMQLSHLSTFLVVGVSDVLKFARSATKFVRIVDLDRVRLHEGVYLFTVSCRRRFVISSGQNTCQTADVVWRQL